jgi:hypothetical protein
VPENAGPERVRTGPSVTGGVFAGALQSGHRSVALAIVGVVKVREGNRRFDLDSVSMHPTVEPRITVAIDMDVLALRCAGAVAPSRRAPGWYTCIDPPEDKNVWRRPRPLFEPWRPF